MLIYITDYWITHKIRNKNKIRKKRLCLGISKQILNVYLIEIIVLAFVKLYHVNNKNYYNIMSNYSLLDFIKLLIYD